MVEVLEKTKIEQEEKFVRYFKEKYIEEERS